MTTEDRVSRYSVSRFGMMYSVPMIAFGVTRWSLALTFRLSPAGAAAGAIRIRRSDRIASAFPGEMSSTLITVYVHGGMGGLQLRCVL